MTTIGNESKPAYVYDSETDTWVPIGIGTHTHDEYIEKTVVGAKGSIIVGSAADTPANLAAGTAGQFLSVDATTPTGLLWTSDLINPLSVTGNITSTRLRLTSTTDASLSSTDHAFQVGPTSGTNLIIDGNEIIARNNEVASGLFINPTGGNVQLGDATSVISAAGTVNFTGTITGTPADATVSTAATGIGFRGIPQSATATTEGPYTIQASDAGDHIYAFTSRTITIPANGTLALPVGTTIVFIAGAGATMTIAITTDTLRLVGAGTTGTRTLAPHGMATAVKVTSTLWYISGNGLT
jgi:hypothetical protein